MFIFFGWVVVLHYSLGKEVSLAQTGNAITFDPLDVKARTALFDGIEEGGIRASLSYSSHEIDEHENEKALEGLQDRVNLLKRGDWPVAGLRSEVADGRCFCGVANEDEAIREKCE
nr:bet1-like SNARE 1-1 [Ipomoea batatas]